MRSLHAIFGKLKKQSRQRALLRALPIAGRPYPLATVNEINLLMNEKAYLHDLEVPVLQKYASLAEKTVVEIGCAFGASSALLLANAKQGAAVHSIDPFIPDSMSGFNATAEKCRLNVKQVLSALKRDATFSQWNLHADYSYNAVTNWNYPIDVLFIDGDHRYEAVKKDFEDWFPKVRSGGVILLHDSRKESGTPADTFNRGWAGPTRLANELKDDKRIILIEEAFSITAWKKI